jgi:amino acid transporter
VIVLSNLAGVAVTFFYLFIARVTGIESIADLATDKLVNIITCLAFIAGSTWIAYRGISTTERLQIVLVGFQMLVLAIFTVVAITKALSGEDLLASRSPGTGSTRSPGSRSPRSSRASSARSSRSGAGTPASPSTRRARTPPRCPAGRRSSPC